MRCALSYDDNKTFSSQKVSAWGEMQSLSEEPCYKEEDIESITDKEYLIGYKMAMDDISAMLYEIEDEERELLERAISGGIAMQLFSILDKQEEKK